MAALFGLPFATWLTYMLTFTAIVGFASGVILALLWALRAALGAEPQKYKDEIARRRALVGLLYLLGGLGLGAVLTSGPVLVLLAAVLLLAQWLFVGDPPALIATMCFGLLMVAGLMIAARFGSWWRRRFWSRLPV